jgi:hypothetical protein
MIHLSSNSATLMNSTAALIPGIRTLYYCDRTFSRALRTFGFCLFATFMIRWATQPVPSAVDIVKSPFDIWMAELGPPVALVVAVLALIVTVRRYFWVRKIISEGTIIQGTVEDLDIYEREASHSDTTPAFERPKIRTYYATIRFNWRGADHQVRYWLPYGASTYKIFKGKETDLILLDSAPKKALLRSLYLEEFAPRKRSWWQ